MLQPHLVRLGLVAVSATALACSADRVVEPAANELASRVKALGFSSQGMEDHGDYLVVEGDIRLDKGALVSASSDDSRIRRVPYRPLYQYYTDALVSESNVTHIVVDLSNISAVSDWANAARNAIADYNSSGSLIYMSEGSPGDITFSSVATFYPDTVTIAQASFPYQGTPSGKPGPTITVSQRFNGYTLGQKEKVLVHEFGHTLGLRHDNAAATEGSGGIGANRVYSTPTIDPGSVMVTPYNGSPWSGFDQYDIYALKYLYNPIRPTIVGPSTIANYRQCTWTVNVVGGVPPYTYAWQVQEPGYSYFYPQSGSQQSFVTSGNPPFSGTFYISVQVTDATGFSAGRAMPAYDTGYGGYDHTYCT